MVAEKEHKSARNIPRKGLTIALLSLAVLLVVGLTARRGLEQPKLAYWIAQLPVTFPMKTPNGQATFAEAQSFTMNGFTYGVSADEQEAMSAIEAAGTNALPYLIDVLGSRDNRVKLWTLAALNKCGYSPPFMKPKDGTRFQAVTALRLLGTNASPALPELQALTRSNDPNVAAAALLVIQNLSHPTPPWLKSF